jgi:hypothetical protein
VGPAFRVVGVFLPAVKVPLRYAEDQSWYVASIQSRPAYAPWVISRQVRREQRQHSCMVASIVSRRAGRTFSDLACGTGIHPIHHGARIHRNLREAAAPAHNFCTVGRCVQTGGANQPHPYLLAHVFQIAGFNWEYLGSREDLGYRDAQKTPRSTNTP